MAHLRARVLADVFFVRVDVHERAARPRQRKAGGGLLVQPAAENDQQVAFLIGEILPVLVRGQQIAGVVRMIVGERVLPFVRCQHGELKLFGEVDDFLPRMRILGSRTDQEHRFTRPIDAPDQGFDGGRIGIGLDRRQRLGHGDVGVGFRYIARQRHHHRAGPAAARDMKCPAHDARDLFGIVDLDDPLGDAAEKSAVVELLAGLAAARVAADLANQQHHRRRIVFRAMNGDACVGRPGTAGDDADTGSARGLGIAFGHKRGAAFLAIGDKCDLRVIHQPVDDGDITFARHAKNMFNAFVAQALSYRMAAKHGVVSYSG